MPKLVQDHLPRSDEETVPIEPADVDAMRLAGVEVPVVPLTWRFLIVKGEGDLGQVEPCLFETAQGPLGEGDVGCVPEGRIWGDDLVPV
jgi:hypothetical protein